MERKLVGRNALEEVVASLVHAPLPTCRVIESVSTSLEGQKLASFTRVSTAVQQVGRAGSLTGTVVGVGVQSPSARAVPSADTGTFAICLTHCRQWSRR